MFILNQFSYVKNVVFIQPVASSLQRRERQAQKVHHKVLIF